MASQPGEISRRRVLAGVAWTTPAIVLSVSVPRAAASTVAGSVIVVSSVEQGASWGSQQSLGAEISAYLGYNQEWADAGVTAVTATLTLTATKTDEPNAGKQYVATTSGALTIGGASLTAIADPVDPGSYDLSYTIVAEPATGTDGNTYQAESIINDPPLSSVVVPEASE